MLFWFLVGPSVVGALIGVIIAVDHRKRVRLRMAQIQKQIAELMVFHGSDIRQVRESVLDILDGHRCDVHETTEEAVIFSHPLRGEWGALTISFWTVITFGGALIFFGVLYAVAQPDVRHELRLAP